jgi:hypothetical protein
VAGRIDEGGAAAVDIEVSSRPDVFDIDVSKLPLEPTETYFALVESEEPQRLLEFVPSKLKPDTIRSESGDVSMAAFEADSRRRC